MEIPLTAPGLLFRSQLDSALTVSSLAGLCH